MAKGRVLVIDSDEWVARLLSAGLRDYGFDVSTSTSGVQGLEAARTIQPDCVVTEMIVGEIDGAAVVRALRGEAGPVSAVPVVFLTNADEASARQMAFQAGCDVYLTKPFRVEEIAMQVHALVAMAARLRGPRDQAPTMAAPAPESSSPESAAPGGHAIEGNIAQMSIATVLTLLEMEHRTGTLTISTKGRKCTLEMVGGFASQGAVGGSKVSPLAVLRQILCWKEGRFRFRPGTDTVIPAAANRRSIGALLIEAVRLDDESALERSGMPEDEPPTSKRSILQSASGSVPPPSRRAGAGARRMSRPPAPPPASKPSVTVKRASRPPAPPAAPGAVVPRPPPVPIVRPAAARPGQPPPDKKA